MTINITPAKSSELSIIAELADKIWRVHYTPIIGQEQVDYMLLKMYSLQSLILQQEQGQQFFIAELDKQAIGYISITAKGPDFFLHKFYINIEEQGKGFGKIIFNDLLSKFPLLKTMRLQVNRMNFKTINFYFRLGFVIEAAKNFEIGDGYTMDDYVMVFKK